MVLSRRRFSALALATVLLGAVAGCSSAEKDEKFKVVTTFTIIADIARNVAGDAAVVESITKAGAEIHDYRRRRRISCGRRAPISCCGTG
jgi:manganese/iron transport system substrate-binding protein